MKTQHGKRGLFTPKWWLGAFIPQQRVHPVRKFRGPWWALACSECPCVGKLLRGPGDARDLLRLSMFGFGNRSTAIAPPITAAVNANILAALQRNCDTWWGYPLSLWQPVLILLCLRVLCHRRWVLAMTIECDNAAPPAVAQPHSGPCGSDQH